MKNSEKQARGPSAEDVVKDRANRLVMALDDVQAEEGETITLTLGQEIYSPVKYNTFTVGPFSTTVRVRRDEDRNEAILRGYRLLNELNEAEFNLAWERHSARIKKLPRND